MELGTCPRCGAYVLAGRTNGYDVVVNTNPLDAQRLTAALLGGRQIYRPRRSETGRVVGLKWIRPGSEPLDPSMVDEHECPNVVVRPVKAPVDPQEPVPAPAARAGSLRGSEALPAPRSAPCDSCRRPVVIDGPELYIAIELGATVVWARHERCSG